LYYDFTRLLIVIKNNEDFMRADISSNTVGTASVIIPPASSDTFEENFDVSMNAHRVSVDEKRIINCRADVNQLVPFKYKWAWQKYLDACANHWMPQEINMNQDIALWKSAEGLSSDERHIIMRNLGFFSTADSLVANNIVLSVYRHITNPECRQYLLRQAFEEAIHCYIEGTEVLTTRGFVDFRDLSAKDKVAQYHKDGTIDFVKPDEILVDNFKGELFEFKNESGTYHKIVTPNHRCVAIDPRNDHKLRIIRADKFSPSNYQLPVSGELIGKSEFTWEDAFRVAYQADGFLYRKGHKEYRVRFFLKRKDKITRLIKILKGCDFDYTISRITKGRNAGSRQFEIKVPFDFTFDKEFDWINLRKISSQWIKVFFKEIGRWDGSKRANGAVTYTNTNKSAIDKVTVLAHLASKRAGVYKMKVESDHKAAWQVYIYDQTIVSGKTIEKSAFPYNGKVCCVGVPSGMIVVRYNGVIQISGNTHAYQYCVESLGMDEGEVFNMYREVPVINDKDAFTLKYTRELCDPAFDTHTPERAQRFLRNLIAYYMVMEGIFFYVGFVQMLSFGRQNRMIGCSEQFQYIMRDESMHLNFGIDVINTIIAENPHLWTKDLIAEVYDIIDQGVRLEERYALDTMPRGVLGLNASLFTEYLRFVANRRCEQIGLAAPYAGVQNTFPWMAEVIDLRKEKNFFESRVTEYRTGGALSWDD
jgi:ribonucleotide reductase beta subunit family protein with ferritin-like domain